MTARILEITADEYFAGKDAIAPWLSQSIAHRMLDQTCLHAWTYHPLLGGVHRKATKAMDAGQILHTLLLGKGKQLDIVDAKDWRTKAAQEARDNAVASGFVPVLRHEHDSVMDSLATIQANLAAAGIRLDGLKEVCVEWDEVGESGPVLCRAMMDNVFLDDGLIIDVKKCESAHPRGSGRHMVEYGYDIQHAAYTSAIEHLRPELIGRARMEFAFIELVPPYAVLPARPNGIMRRLGEMKWKRAIKMWERCLITKVFPGYPTKTVDLEPMPWQMSDEILAEEAT